MIASPLIAIIPKYSAMKNSAYLNPEYSVRCPAISSDSASGRSNGQRFDSASAHTRNITNAGRPHGVATNQCQNPPCWASTIRLASSVPAMNTTGTAAMTSGSS